MRALTLVPGQAGSAAVTEVPEPAPGAGELLERLITRRVPLGRFAEALEGRPEDIKVVVDLTA